MLKTIYFADSEKRHFHWIAVNEKALQSLLVKDQKAALD